MSRPDANVLTDRLGRPLRELRLSVTDRCNFRCGYCMPAGEELQFLPRRELLSFEEIARIVRVGAGLGVRKLRLTGGEPLLRRELPQLVRQLASIEGLSDLALTTNGYLLAEQAAALADAGLTRVTVSLDSLEREAFSRATGGDHDPERVLRGIEVAAGAGLTPIKINCVVQRGVNEDAVEDLVRHFRGSGHTLRFIEYMDVGTLNGWQPGAVLDAAAIRARIEAIAELEALPRAAGAVARRYRFRDGSGEVGIIASVSEPFCGDCNRARLSADGRLLTCLFASDGPSVRDWLRAGIDDAELEQRLRAAWQARADRYSEERRERGTTPRRRLEMYQVGG